MCKEVSLPLSASATCSSQTAADMPCTKSRSVSGFGRLKGGQRSFEGWHQTGGRRILNIKQQQKLKEISTLTFKKLVEQTSGAVNPVMKRSSSLSQRRMTLCFMTMWWQTLTCFCQRAGLSTHTHPHDLLLST